MPPEPLGLGVDLGSSGLRLALVAAGDAGTTAQWQASGAYPGRFEDPNSWWQGLISLCQQIPAELARRVGAIAIDGTSGTLLLCRPDGSLLPEDLALALPYHLSCQEQAGGAAALASSGPNPDSAAATSASGSLARALQLLERASSLMPSAKAGSDLLLRHQADWLMGRLLGHWRYGEATNNLRLGWLQGPQPGWAGAIGQQPWSPALPAVIDCGARAGLLSPAAAAELGLPNGAQVVAGCTDASAAVLAAAAGPGDGVTVLGTTLALKQWCSQPIAAAGVSCQQLDGRWLVGGASNGGGGVLLRFFDETQLIALSRQIDPDRPSGLQLRPLPAVGERFPVDDPNLQPVLEPRPVSDALYLQGLLEGLARIEAAGWQRLRQLGAPPVQRVISLGGGSRNPQWRAIRQRVLGIPVLNRPQQNAAAGMARLAATSLSPSADG